MKYPYLIKVLLLFLIYFATARFGLSLDAVAGFATLIWLPTGISLAALLIFGIELWPAITLGAFAANFAVKPSLSPALGIALGNTLEAAVAVYVLKRFLSFRRSLSRPKDVFALILVALFSAMISATIGTYSLLISHTIKGASYPLTWVSWWLGDFISDLVVAPFILVWGIRYRFFLRSKKMWEVLALFFSQIAVSIIVFGDAFNLHSNNKPITYILFPTLVWAAFRFL